MKMQALVALVNFPYGKRNLKAGDTFYATPRDAKLLVTIRRAQIDPAGDEMTAKRAAPEEPPIKVVAEAMGLQAPAKKRAYRRRQSASHQ